MVFYRKFCNASKKLSGIAFNILPRGSRCGGWGVWVRRVVGNKKKTTGPTGFCQQQKRVRHCDSQELTTTFGTWCTMKCNEQIHQNISTCVSPPHPLPFWQFLSFGSVCYSFTSQNYQNPLYNQLTKASFSFEPIPIR